MDAGGTSRIDAAIERLSADAQQITGLSDFGPFEWKTALRKLLSCIETEMPLGEQGNAVIKADVVRILVNRLRMQADINRHPEILDEDVSDPFVIIGLPRSGTTKLHKMLSAPDNVQKTLFWRLWNPAPFPDARPGTIDPRIAAMGSSSLLTKDNPVADAAHHMEECEVEEEGVLYQMTFKDYAWDQILTIPSYFNWVMSEPSIDTYRYVKTVFQYLQWQDGGKRGRPWVFKSVAYIANLESLLACYPKATLIQPHRDPRRCLPSFAKFTHGLTGMYIDQMDKHRHGSEALRTWTIAIERYMDARHRLNLDDRIIDVDYEQVRSDPMSIMQMAYELSPYELNVHTREKMLEWHNSNEQGRYGKHRYSLQEFGLHEDDIERGFGKYSRRFIRNTAH